MAIENERECEAAGLDLKKVRSIASRIERAALEAQAMGIQVFGGSSTGTLRFDDGKGPPLIIAVMDGNWSGGDGGEMPGDDGLMRAEGH